MDKGLWKFKTPFKPNYYVRTKIPYGAYSKYYFYTKLFATYNAKKTKGRLIKIDRIPKSAKRYRGY